MIRLPGTKKYCVLTGNYGSGKTEIALNLATQLSPAEKTTLVDLDIVNPYFRSGENKEEMERAGIRMLMPVFALTTVDIPALPAEIQSVFEVPADRVIFDVGGDDTGAAALGRYYPSFSANRENTLMVLVLNGMRPLTRDPEDVCDLAERISSRGRMAFDMIINNTNLADQTTPEMLMEGEHLAEICAERLGIADICNTGMPEVLSACELHHPAYPIRRKMVPEWMGDL